MCQVLGSLDPPRVILPCFLHSQFSLGQCFASLQSTIYFCLNIIFILVCGTQVLKQVLVPPPPNLKGFLVACFTQDTVISLYGGFIPCSFHSVINIRVYFSLFVFSILVTIRVVHLMEHLLMSFKKYPTSCPSGIETGCKPVLFILVFTVLFYFNFLVEQN